jgi:hypothetical protein
MMTPEKSTMADKTGGKRDRLSDDTDKPETTPNTRDAKISCWDDEDLDGKPNEPETVENEPPSVISSPDRDNSSMQDSFASVEPSVIDVDALISSGGLEKDDNGHPTGKPAPKNLFSDFSDYEVDEDDDVAAGDDDDEPEDDAADTSKEQDDSADTSDTNQTTNTNDLKNEIHDEKNKNKKEKEEQITKITEETSDTQNSTIVPHGRKIAPVALDLTTFKQLTGKWKSLDNHS